MSHTCHVNNCTKPVERRMLMCQFHWALVPTEMQVAVKNHFNPKQCSGAVRPSVEYLRAAREALNYVAKATGNWHETSRPAGAV